MRRALALILAVFPCRLRRRARGRQERQAKPRPTQTVDSGSFGIFIKGQRVATETFHIEQIRRQQHHQVATQGNGRGRSDQPEIGPGTQFQWRVVALRMEPVLGRFAERVSRQRLPEGEDHDPSASAKPAEQAFLLPSTTPILDNNFFIHREVLAWKYLAVCSPARTRTACRHASRRTLARSSPRTELR